MQIKDLQMVDLRRQYQQIQVEIQEAMQEVLQGGQFINGPQVKRFAKSLSNYLQSPYVITCANGTDALQIALMALDLKPGDEVILPAFTYIAAVEVVALLGLTPILVDVDPFTYNIDPTKVESVINKNTKAIIVVHLFGQCAEMESIMQIARKYKLRVIEDNAQSLGAVYTFEDGTKRYAGTIGDIGTTSFFPTKPLACYGDGGAIFTKDEDLALRIQMIASHGQEKKYYHQVIGVNSRLDTLQAAILEVKLRYQVKFNTKRQYIAARYDAALLPMSGIIPPHTSLKSSHIYHQYTIQIEGEGQRDLLQKSLKEEGIPSMIYYPLPLQQQPAYKWVVRSPIPLTNSDRLSKSVLSLPIHSEMTDSEIDYIIQRIIQHIK